MSKYTTEVRFICETLAGYDMSQGYGKVNDIINASWDKIFDFDFPIFDENYRPVLCKKIIKHFYTREIGLETVGLWKLKLETKMQEIMPYYNKLYESESLQFNPLRDVDYERTTQGEEEGNNTTNRNGSRTGSVDTTSSGTRGNTRHDDNTHWDLFSDTPQNGLTGVEEQNYLTDARKITDGRTITDAGTVSDTGSTDTTEATTGRDVTDFNNTKEYVEHVVGKMPGRTYANMLVEYRNSLINIDLQIIDRLSDLFMKLW